MQLLTPGVGLIIWQTIVFVLLFLLLAKLAWKPIINSLKDRERSIQDREIRGGGSTRQSHRSHAIHQSSQGGDCRIRAVETWKREAVFRVRNGEWTRLDSCLDRRGSERFAGIDKQQGAPGRVRRCATRAAIGDREREAVLPI